MPGPTAKSKRAQIAVRQRPSTPCINLKRRMKRFRNEESSWYSSCPIDRSKRHLIAVSGAMSISDEHVPAYPIEHVPSVQTVPTVQADFGDFKPFGLNGWTGLRCQIGNVGYLCYANLILYGALERICK